jgi:hypothetical protein
MLQCETVIRAEQTIGLTPLPLLPSFGGMAYPFPFISSMTLFCKIFKIIKHLPQRMFATASRSSMLGWHSLRHLDAIVLSEAPDQLVSVACAF